MWELQYLQLYRFSYSVAYGRLVSQSGIEPSSPTLQGEWLTTGPPGKAPWHALSACFYTLYIKRCIVWWEYITIQGGKDLACFKNVFIHTGQIQPGVFHHAEPFHAMCFFIDYSLNTSNRLSSSTVSVQWHLKLFFMHPGLNTSSCISPSSVSLLWHAFSVSLSTPGQTYSVAYHYPHFKEEVQLHLGPPELK